MGSDEQVFPLRLPRAGNLKVDSYTATEYGALIPFVQRHARSAYIYAAPDCPEVYFLSGLRNPTRTFFDFFDDSTKCTQHILSVIDSHNVNVVVVLTTPSFSPAVSPDLKKMLERWFPYWVNIGRFEVRWKE
jgi:hypothetical protein